METDKTFHIITFGCQMNVADSQWLSSALEKKGWHRASEQQAKVVLINTCSVREKPEQKVYSLLGRFRDYWKANPDFFVGVGGCVAQQIGESFWQRFPYVRLVFGPDGVSYVPDKLDLLMDDPRLRVSLLEFLDFYPERQVVQENSELKGSAFVNIMQGCDNFCTYCIVPFTRGRQKSRTSDAVLTECRALVVKGVKEITLLGQNVNSFGQDKYGDQVSFAELLGKVCSIPGLKRVRFTTSHPKDIAKEVVEAFGLFDNLCPALHLPLQSGSDRVLKRMNRRYTRKEYLQIVKDLKTVRPELILTTDLIVGFPGENEEDFQQTLEMVEEVGFASSYSFKYSDRPGTKATNFPDKVGEGVKAERLARLQALQDELTVDSLQQMVGREVEVLVESASIKGPKGHFWQGREPGGRIVNFEKQANNLSGQLMKIKITEAKRHSLFGKVID